MYRVSERSLVPDPSLSIRDGAIAALPLSALEETLRPTAELADPGAAQALGMARAE